MNGQRIQQEAISANEFWAGLNVVRCRRDLYEGMSLYDARTAQTIVLEVNEGGYWTFYVDGEPGELFSQPTTFLLKMHKTA